MSASDALPLRGRATSTPTVADAVSKKIPALRIAAERSAWADAAAAPGAAPAVAARSSASSIVSVRRMATATSSSVRFFCVVLRRRGSAAGAATVSGSASPRFWKSTGVSNEPSSETKTFLKRLKGSFGSVSRSLLT